ncbi:MAG TPA: recombinase RecT, partial [Acidobacteriota bacterium]|nr:recombinase RecT [Acidobacteriota bacterium]
MAPTKNEVTKHEQIQEIVLNRINQLQQERGLALPANYNPTNALISARLILNQTLDKTKRPVLET